jgi:hypothetical protein
MKRREFMALLLGGAAVASTGELVSLSHLRCRK